MHPGRNLRYPARVTSDFHADERGSFLPTLGFEHQAQEDGGSGSVTLTDYMSSAPGWPSAAVMLTFADVLIGIASSRRTAPRISITSSLSVHLSGPVPEGSRIDMQCHILRSGRSVTVGETLATAGGRSMATAIGTFQASPRPQDTVAPWMDRPLALEHITSDFPSFAEHIGVRFLAPGVTEIDLRSDLMNATEALQGGLVAFLGEMAAQSAATAAAGATAVVDSLEVHYLAAARVGPFLARSESIGPHVQQVSITDPGRDDRLVSVIVARTRPAGEA